MMGGAGAAVMLIVSIAPPVPTAFVAVTGTANVPVAVGVPVISWDVELKLSPAGRLPTVYAVGLPVAER